MSNSTSGYIPEIGFLQFRHFPRSTSQLSTGTLSYGRIGAAHFGHADAGITIDLFAGIRRMQTFRKLPMINPKANTNTPISAGGSTHRICHIAAPLSRQRAAAVSDS